MNRLLIKDQDDFERCFPEATRFLRAAHLRCEAFNLSRNEHRNEWQENRLAELLMTPACGVAWFQKTINKTEPCGLCDNTGIVNSATNNTVDDGPEKPCPDCGGTGEIKL